MICPICDKEIIQSEIVKIFNSDIIYCENNKEYEFNDGNFISHYANDILLNLEMISIKENDIIHTLNKSYDKNVIKYYYRTIREDGFLILNFTNIEFELENLNFYKDYDKLIERAAKLMVFQ